MPPADTFLRSCLPTSHPAPLLPGNRQDPAIGAPGDEEHAVGVVGEHNVAHRLDRVLVAVHLAAGAVVERRSLRRVPVRGGKVDRNLPGDNIAREGVCVCVCVCVCVWL